MAQALASVTRPRRDHPRLVLSVALPLAAAGCASSLAHVTTLEVRSEDALECRAFFGHEDEPVEHVVMVLNGTGTGSNAFVHPSMEELVRTRGTRRRVGRGRRRRRREDPSAARSRSRTLGSRCAVSGEYEELATEPVHALR